MSICLIPTVALLFISVKQCAYTSDYVLSFAPEINSLGWVFYKQGRFREAGGIFRQILRSQADDGDGGDEHAVIFDHAGDVYYRLGWKQKAVELWTRALELAKKEKLPTLEIRKILSDTQAKIKAAKSNREPVLAPLGGDRKDKPKE